MRTLALFAIGLIFGGGIGFVTAAGMGVTFDGHNHGDPAHHGTAAGGHGMDHDTPLEVDASNAPQLLLTSAPDPMSGYNLHLNVENFEFSPQQASLEHVEGQGHAHLYVNGVKKRRLYGPWVHLDGLPKGRSTIEVTLNANDHRPLALGGDMIKSTLFLTVE